MVGLLRVLCLASQGDVDIDVALAVLLALVDPWNLIAVFTILIIVMMPAIVRVALLIKII